VDKYQTEETTVLTSAMKHTQRKLFNKGYISIKFLQI